MFLDCLNLFNKKGEFIPKLLDISYPDKEKSLKQIQHHLEKLKNMPADSNVIIVIAEFKEKDRNEIGMTTQFFTHNATLNMVLHFVAKVKVWAIEMVEKKAKL